MKELKGTYLYELVKELKYTYLYELMKETKIHIPV
jgi:hypothetical protein